MRAANLLWLGITAAVAFGVFLVAYEVRQLEEKRDQIHRDIADAERDIHVLRAEWSYLNSPHRLDALAQRHLDLGPLQGPQMIAIEDLPARNAVLPKPGFDAMLSSAGMEP
jgi:cell division protein FtsL